MVYIAYRPEYVHELPEGHRFPMLKYELIPQQLLREGTITSGQLFAPDASSAETVLLTHSAGYLNKLLDQTLSATDTRKIGFPQSPELTSRELFITQGSIDCCYHALRHGIALNVAGGTHHAFRDRGEGFCLLNDFAVAANFQLQQRLAHKILIIDLDVHQGNGTASIFGDEPRVFTFSMHGRHNYPFRKEHSDLDIPLEDNTNDEEYLKQLEDTLPRLIQSVQPDFAFYLSGVDILSTDRFGKLNISMEGCRQRDRYVLSTLQQHRIPVTVAMGGGYSKELKHIVEAHCNTFRVAMDLYG